MTLTARAARRSSASVRRTSPNARASRRSPSPATELFPAAPPLRRPDARALVGTSGWSYDDWQECFYPPGVRGAERLSYYAQQFDAVELNVSFYRVPTPPMIAAWNARLHQDFHLAAKGTRLVTHVRRLADVDEVLRFYYERVLAIERVEVVLWQLPPGLKQDRALLADFLSRLPGRVKHAIEFRHASWWDDAVASLLSEHGVAFAAISHPSLPDVLYPTTDFLYLRFHGTGGKLYDYEYTEPELAAWAARVGPELRGRRLYAFFNNDYRCQAVRNARTFRALLEEHPAV